MKTKNILKFKCLKCGAVYYRDYSMSKKQKLQAKFCSRHRRRRGSKDGGTFIPTVKNNIAFL